MAAGRGRGRKAADAEKNQRLSEAGRAKVIGRILFSFVSTLFEIDNI